MEKGLQDESNLAFNNLNGVAELEAKVTFLSTENLDLKNEVQASRQTSSLEISRLSEQIQEMNETVQDARIATTKLQIYEKKMEEMTQLQSKLLKQENELEELRDMNHLLQSSHHKIQKAEKAALFYKDEALQAKKQANLLKMELDKERNAVQLKTREIEESNRINQLRESQYQLKESELRETTAKLSVYQQLDVSSRMQSAVDDIQPELTTTKDLKKKIAELERQNAVLKQDNATELAEEVLQLQQECEDKTQELERQSELTKMAERRAEELESRQQMMQS